MMNKTIKQIIINPNKLYILHLFHSEIFIVEQEKRNIKGVKKNMRDFKNPKNSIFFIFLFFILIFVFSL